MKTLINSLFILFTFTTTASSQTVVHMEESGGVYVMPCEINGLPLEFIFDTGASDVSISMTEALFMLKHGYISESDLGESEYYSIANGDLVEGTELILCEVKVGDVVIHDVKASIMHEMTAPLLLGQSVLSRLGKISFNYSDNTLTIDEENQVGYYSNNEAMAFHESDSGGYEPYKYVSYFAKGVWDGFPLRKKPRFRSEQIYACPRDSKIYVIDNSGPYFRVNIDGYIGYVSQNSVKDKG